jgi:hypothetical protein
MIFLNANIFTIVIVMAFMCILEIAQDTLSQNQVNYFSVGNESIYFQV